jgi:amino acid transporter
MLLAAIGALTSAFFQTQWNINIPWWAFTIAFAVIVWGIGILGVSRTATTALIFLTLEVSVMLALFVTILAKGGAQGVSLAPFNPANSLNAMLAAASQLRFLPPLASLASSMCSLDGRPRWVMAATM